MKRSDIIVKLCVSDSSFSDILICRQLSVQTCKRFDEVCVRLSIASGPFVILITSSVNLTSNVYSLTVSEILHLDVVRACWS